MLRYVAFMAAVCASLCAMVAAQGTTVQGNLRVANCPSDATDLNDCDVQGYVIRVAVFSAPGLIVAAFFLLAAPTYLISKYCCNCCGGRYQSPNFCCPAEDLDAIYSKGDILRPKIILFIVLGATVGAFIWGYLGGGKLESGLVDFGSGIENVPVLLRAQLNAMDVSLTVEVYSATTDSFTTTRLLQEPANSNIMEAGNQTINDLSSLVNDNVGAAKDYVKQYSFIVFVFFAIPVAIFLLGIIFALCNVRRYGPMVLVWLTFFFGFIVWICHAVFCLSSMVVADGCVEIHGVAFEQQTVLPALVGCKDSMFNDFTQGFNDLRDTTTQQLCTQISQYCYDSTQTPIQNANNEKTLVCPSPMDCTTVTFGQMTTWVQTAFYTHPNIAAMDGTTTNTDGYRCTTPANLNSCYLNICQTDCTVSGGALSVIGKLAKQMYNGYEIDRAISNTIDTQASQYANCDSLFTLMIAPLDPSCEVITKALIADRQASGFLGLCMIAGLFCLAWGAKRFISTDLANVPIKQDPNAVETIPD